MTQPQHITTTGRAARALRGACALALAALALSACASGPERAEQIAIQKKLEAINTARMDLAISTMIKRCPAILSEEGIEPFLARMEAKAAALGPQVSPPLAVNDGFLIDSALYEDAPTPGVALRVRIYDPFAAERTRMADPVMGQEAILPELELHHVCGADVILAESITIDRGAKVFVFHRGSNAIRQDLDALWSHAPKVADDLAVAVGGQASSMGSSTLKLPASVKTASRSYSVMLAKSLPDRIAIAPDLFHDAADPVKVSDKLRFDRVYRTGAYIASTPR